MIGQKTRPAPDVMEKRHLLHVFAPDQSFRMVQQVLKNRGTPGMIQDAPNFWEHEFGRRKQETTGECLQCSHVLRRGSK
jgi:hypothetical protein